MSQNSDKVSPFSIKQGEFKVDANGQATYRLPILMPPGIIGHTPELELVYGHRNGNGACGVGWEILGSSAITLTNATQAVDGFRGGVNFDRDDRFMLDGQRLINIEGAYGAANTVYYTEIHNWKKVVAGESPQSGFVVYLKNGEKWEYGTTADSLILTSDAKYVRVWALAAKEDLNGNRMEYAYTTSPVSGLDTSENYYLSSITYNNAIISLNYLIRENDKMVSYLAGYRMTRSCILSSIDVKLPDGTAIYAYTLSYQPSCATGLSRLDNIVVADGAGNMLPAVQLNWQDVIEPSLDTTQRSSALLGSSKIIKTLPLDINGDGITDIVQIYSDESGVLCAATFLASLSGSGQISYNKTQDITLGYYGDNDYQIFSGDVNGSGLCDLLIAYSSDNSLAIDVYLSTGTGYQECALTTNTSDPWQGNDSVSFYAVDVDGDGRIDLVEAYSDNVSGSSLLYFNTYLSQFTENGGTFSATISTTTHSLAPSSSQYLWAMDVNGDGLVDMVLLWEDLNNSLWSTSFISRSSSEGLQVFATTRDTSLGISTQNQIAIFPADVNGDGLLDIVQVCYSLATPLSIQSIFSTADGGFISGPESPFPDMTVDKNNLYPMGFNGGVQTCLLSCWLDADDNWNFTMLGSSPDGSFRHIDDINSKTAFPRLSFFIGDANGDGKADLFYIYSDANDVLQLQPFTSSGPFPDLLTSVTDMAGNVNEVAYAPLSDASVYSTKSFQYPKTSAIRYPCRLSPAQYPVQEILGKALYVVSSYSFCNDTLLNRFDYCHKFNMVYSNARIDLNGRGWEGFELVTTIDTNTGLRTTQKYLQDFPYVGVVFSTQVEADSSIATDPNVPKDQSLVMLKRSISTYQSVSHPGATPNCCAYELQLSGILDYAYDYGTFDYQMARSFAYDNYGNKNLDVWWGYVNFIDPDSILPTSFPSIDAINPQEAVYTYRAFQNDLLSQGWALGYQTYEKKSSNDSDEDITLFCTGDYSLSSRTYCPSTYNLDTQSHWDDSNNCFITASFTYDGYGNMLSKTHPGNITTTYEYESKYNTYLSKQISPENEQGIPLISCHGYDPRFGINAACLDENGDIHINVFDGFGRVICQQGPVPDGCKQSDPNGVTEFVTGNVNFANASVLTVEKMTYLNDGVGGIYGQVEMLQQFPDSSDRDFLCKQKYVDGLGRECQIAVDAGQQGYVVTLASYSACGKPENKSLPFFSSILIKPLALNVIQYTYDILGRPLTCVSPYDNNGNMTTNTWCYSAGEKITLEMALGTPEAYSQVITGHHYHGKQHQVLSVIPTDNNAVTAFAFDPLGRMISSVDPIGVTNDIVYDSLNRTQSQNNPDQNTNGSDSVAFCYTYDSITGNLCSVEDASGNQITYVYDNLSRVISQRFTDEHVFQFTYDDLTNSSNSIGKLSEVVINDANGEQQFSRLYTYDSYGNITGENVTIGTEAFAVSSEYDPIGRLVSQTLPDDSIENRTYESGMLVAQQLDSVKIEYPLSGYTAFGNCSRMTAYYNGTPTLYSSYTFGPQGNVYSETIANSSSLSNAILNFGYDYDHLGQLLNCSETIQNRIETFSYSSRRLIATSVMGDQNSSESYSYNTAGNILSKDGNNYSAYNAHFPLNISSDGSQVYTATQDLCGKTLSRTLNGVTNHFVYDGSSNLIQINDGESILRDIVYDEHGERVKETKVDGTVVYYINPAYQVTVQQSQKMIKKYLFDHLGPSVSIEVTGDATDILFFRRDRKGSVTHTFDATGALQDTIIYAGFGAPTITGIGKGTEVFYEGKKWDSSIELYYFGARYYDPFIGSFLTPDSVLGGRNHLQSDVWNRFAFELNNPVNHVDSSGHMADWIWGVIIGVAIVAAAVAIVATGGAATPFVSLGLISAEAATTTAAAVATGAVVGGLAAAGTTAIAYSVTHRNQSGGKFWGSFGIHVGIAFGIGALAGAAASQVSTLTMAPRILTLAGLESTKGTLTQVFSNLATGKSAGQGAVSALVFGMVFGLIGGGATGALESRFGSLANEAQEEGGLSQEMVNMEGSVPSAITATSARTAIVNPANMRLSLMRISVNISKSLGRKYTANELPNIFGI